MGHKRCQLCQVVQKNGEKGFFSFPSIKRKSTHENWLKVCDFPADTETKKMSVCFRHFQLTSAKYPKRTDDKVQIHSLLDELNEKVFFLENYELNEVLPDKETLRSTKAVYK